jgi:hypothetical protein
MNKVQIEIPSELQAYLNAYGVQARDGFCGEPVFWGYEINRRCEEDVWSQLSRLGPLECIDRDPSNTRWALVTKYLTREEAEKQYGPITNEEFGPRGGWRSVTFGNKKFMSKALRPT